MTPSTAYLVLGPLVLFVPLYLLGGTRRWVAVVAAAGLAVEAFACLRLPADSGVVILERTLVLGAAARMALAWAAGASALPALAAALRPSCTTFAPFLLPAVAAAGATLAVEPGLPSLAAMGLVVPLAAWLFQARTARAGRGAARMLAAGAMGLCAFVVADVLLTRALTAEVAQVPPWAAIGVLALIGVAAYLGLFPFSASLGGMVDGREPLAVGWAIGVFQPLVLVNLVRAVEEHPELLAAAPAHSLALTLAAAGALLGAAFAAASDRPSRTLAYTTLVGMSILFLRLVAADGRVDAVYWLGVAGYSVAAVLASVALAAVERDDAPASGARWNAGALALLLTAALGLCALPTGVGFWVGWAAFSPWPAWVERELAAVPLVAAIGWWRVLWAAVRGMGDAHAGMGRVANAGLWLLAGAGLALFVWPAPLLRITSALAAALGSL